MIKVASYNMRKGVGLDRKRSPERILAVLKEIDADVIALQEADRRFGDREGVIPTSLLAERSDWRAVDFGMRAGSMGWHGNALLVRKAATVSWRAPIHLPALEPRGAVVAELALPRGHGPLRVVAAHFGLLRRCRTRQAAAILEAIARGPAMPTLLLGDLNEWRSDGTRSALRALEPVLGPVTGGPPSFPSRLPILALDRILGCSRALVRGVEAHDSALARLASDHLPLKAWVRLRHVAAAAAPAVPSPAAAPNDRMAAAA
jgi:endonuclease/exonuclease/phosphatase family metal-dependent hydrolase